MKRERQDPFEYLGGDLALIQYDNELDSTKQASLTKAQRNEIRKQANKKWKLIDRKVDSGKDPNPRHSLYYKQQLPLLLDPHEWILFQTSLVQSLPVTFRLGWSCPSIVKDTMIHRIKTDFKTMKGKYIEINGNVLKEDIVKPITWMGSLDTWQIAADSVTLSKNIGLEHLSSYLRNEVQLGHVVRQELASMIPAYLLKIESHHKILDICAAPGSKTEQLLSLLKLSNRDKNQVCTGMVVANDADPIRIETLRTRYQRCASANLMITCSRAEDLQRKLGNAVFDRIVADVPCSGDGTIRKFPHIWRLFRPRMALELHTIQLQIAIASVLLLKPGGRMVYSTCSINPIEDEAVVCALLKHFKGQLKLIDTRCQDNKDLLPNMVSRPGLSTWLCDKEVFVIGEPDEVARKASLDRLPPTTSSMLPPTTEEAVDMHLDYCHRILPHDNDTGGFFVAVLELAVCFDYHNYSNVQKKKGKSPSKAKEVDSIQIMKKLGYNPKSKHDIIDDDDHQGTKTTITDYKSFSCDENTAIMQQLQLNEMIIGGGSNDSHATDNTTNTATQSSPYYMCSCRMKGGKGIKHTSENVNKLLQQLHCLLYQEKQHQYLPNNSSIMFGSKTSGWLKSASSHSIEHQKKYKFLYDLLQKHHSTTNIHNSNHIYISIVSSSIKVALDTWGTEFLDILVQAGSMLASSYLSSQLAIHDTSTKTAYTTTATNTTIPLFSPFLSHTLYSLLPTCSTAVALSCANESLLLKLSMEDFQLLLQTYMDIISKVDIEVSEEVNQDAIVNLKLDDEALLFVKDLLCKEYQQVLITKIFRTIVEHQDRISYSEEIEEDMDITCQHLSKIAKHRIIQSIQSCQDHINTLNNSYHIKDNNQVYTSHILLSIDDTCIDVLNNINKHDCVINTTTTSAVSSSKRRLSKSDRKRLKKQNPSSLAEDSINASNNNNNNNQIIDRYNLPAATIILQYSYHMKSQQHYISILTALDTCQSYLTALSYRADNNSSL